MKFDETKQYVIEVKKIIDGKEVIELEVRDLELTEEVKEERAFEPALEPKPITKLDERVAEIEQEQAVIVDVLSDLMGV